jgi:hypothetical protein
METDIIVPDSYNGYPVVGINGGAFYQNNTIVTVEIGANIAYIGDEAFREVGTLSTVTIGTGSALTSIGDYSFYDCNALTTFNIASDNVITSIGEGAFESCGTLAIFDRMYNLVSISYNAFYGCYGLATFYISETVTVIEGGAFSHSVFGSSSLVIQTPLASQPATWDSAWKADDVTVTWSYSV